MLASFRNGGLIGSPNYVRDCCQSRNDRIAAKCYREAHRPLGWGQVGARQAARRLRPCREDGPRARSRNVFPTFLIDWLTLSGGANDRPGDPHRAAAHVEVEDAGVALGRHAFRFTWAKAEGCHTARPNLPSPSAVTRLRRKSSSASVSRTDTAERTNRLQPVEKLPWPRPAGAQSWAPRAAPTS
jgi:hypothetical protein